MKRSSEWHSALTKATESEYYIMVYYYMYAKQNDVFVTELLSFRNIIASEIVNKRNSSNV